MRRITNLRLRLASPRTSLTFVVSAFCLSLATIVPATAQNIVLDPGFELSNLSLSQGFCRLDAQRRHAIHAVGRHRDLHPQRKHWRGHRRFEHRETRAAPCRR